MLRGPTASGLTKSLSLKLIDLNQILGMSEGSKFFQLFAYIRVQEKVDCAGVRKGSLLNLEEETFLFCIEMKNMKKNKNSFLFRNKY